MKIRSEKTLTKKILNKIIYNVSLRQLKNINYEKIDFIIYCGVGSFLF